jgi:hypothetical protein
MSKSDPIMQQIAAELSQFDIQGCSTLITVL